MRILLRGLIWVGLLAGLEPCLLQAEPYPLRWFYLQTNFGLNAKTDQAIELVNRAATAGFNGVVVSDVKFMLLEKDRYDLPGSAYAGNVERFLTACQQRRVEVIPFLPILSATLAYDPNLAEGYQVDDLLMEVRDQVASHWVDPDVRLQNGGFEEVTPAAGGHRLNGWTGQDAPGKATLSDQEMAPFGSRCLQLVAANAEAGRFCRVGQKVKVKPHRCYRITVDVRTRDLAPADTFGISVSGTGGKEELPLAYNRLRSQPTQPWTSYECVFNSLHFDEVVIHLGLWNAKKGYAWLDNASLQEVGLVNVLRRPGCPLLVRTMDGRLLREGQDFEPVVDPRLGKSTTGGQYDRWHEEVPIRLIEKFSDGTRLKVTYFHPLIVFANQVDACMSEERSYEIWQRLFSRCNGFLHSPRRWFLAFSEIRQVGGCAACQARKQSAGQILADSFRRLTRIIQHVRPQAQVYVWHDMFDPGSNAHSNYYFVLGDAAGSWLGLDPEVTVVSWSFQRRNSMNFFAEPPQAHPQIASIDVSVAPEMTGGNIEKLIRQWFETMDGVPNTQGVMYTTWKNDYAHLEEFARLMMEHPRPAKN